MRQFLRLPLNTESHNAESLCHALFKDVPESSAWQKWRDRSRYTLRKQSFKPDDRNPRYPYDRMFTLGFPVRHAVIKALSGADEKEKLSAAFASTPPWLIWFTFADYTAALLNLALPNLSSVTGFARSKENFPGWYGLPSGAFKSEPWPNGRDNEPLARVDLKLLPSTLLPTVSKRRPDGSFVLLPPRCDLIRRPIRSNEWPMLFPDKSLN